MSTQAANDPLDFSFLQSPPGERVFVDPHYLHLECRGKGNITVLFEAGLGGSALEWQPVIELLGNRAVSCVYDRAGYGWSDPSPFSANATRLALEAKKLLSVADIHGPLILVGHSFGGLLVRRLAGMLPENVVGMVLIDASHEEQLERFEKLGGSAMMPTGENFVLRASGVPENLPKDVYRKIDALSRLRKTYAAVHGEMSNFRLSTKQVKLSRQEFAFPVKVLRRGLSPYSDDEAGMRKTTLWNELQQDLTQLSKQSDLQVATQSGHHIHVDEPELVQQVIEELIDDHKQTQLRKSK